VFSTQPFIEMATVLPHGVLVNLGGTGSELCGDVESKLEAGERSCHAISNAKKRVHEQTVGLSIVEASRVQTMNGNYADQAYFG